MTRVLASTLAPCVVQGNASCPLGCATCRQEIARSAVDGQRTLLLVAMTMRHMCGRRPAPRLPSAAAVCGFRAHDAETNRGE